MAACSLVQSILLLVHIWAIRICGYALWLLRSSQGKGHDPQKCDLIQGFPLS